MRRRATTLAAAPGQAMPPGSLSESPSPLRLAVIASAVAGLSTMGATAAAPSGPLLWGGAQAGATIDQVAAAIPQAKPQTGLVLEDGSQSGLAAAATLAGAPAEALFYFRGKALSAVVVENRALAPGHSRENMAAARRILGLAKSQYGAPHRCIDRPELAALNCIWTTGPVRIAISYHDFGGGSPVLSIIYRPAPP
jgi:hypothetical protein